MASLEEDEDRDLAGKLFLLSPRFRLRLTLFQGSQDGSSDNEIDDTMRDVDENDGDNNDDNDNDNDNDNEQDGDADQDQDQDPDSPSNASQTSEGAGLSSQQNPDTTNMTSPGNGDNSTTLDSFSIYHPSVRAECLTAKTYDIVPTTAAPHSTSINAVTATADMRWVFTGGSDGFTRKFNWAESINSKLMLTVAQRHPFVDSVVKAGVLMTYWENMDGNSLSPVYSLAAQSEGLWLLSGLESGAIRLQTLRHDEGKEIIQLRQHTSAVSSLNLTSDEQSLLSGSWDKRVFDWDLNTGQARRAFGGSAAQICTVQIRPESSIPIPQDTIDSSLPNGTYASNYGASSLDKFNSMDTAQDAGNQEAENPQAGSPTDSLFGGADSLFGDADGGAADGGEPSGGVFGVDDDDEFGRAMANGVLADADAPGETDANMPQSETAPPAETAPTNATDNNENESESKPEIPKTEVTTEPAQPVVNGLPKAEDMEVSMDQNYSQSMEAEQTIGADTTFLAASIDGTIRLWDRRQPDPVARITPQNAPPWCMNACWSPDGNYVYAGRRNGTVEEFSLHKGLREPERTFKFPQGSGPVTALKAMPNGRHLVWSVSS